jgi:hypothetical protein
MTLQDLGSLAEVVGAIATVAALVYLAIQIRANTISTQSESRRASFDMTRPALIAIAENEELARIFNEGLIDFSKLNSTDRTRFAMLFAAFLSPLAVAFDETRIGVGSVTRQSGGVALLLRTPGGRQWWQAFRDRYDHDFRRYVETEILQDDLPAA